MPRYFGFIATLITALFITHCASTPEKRSFGEGVDDSVILAKVKSKLLADDDVKGSRVNVDVRKGVVTLKGTVESTTQVNAAVKAARSVTGVKTVKSQLAVRSGPASRSSATQKGELVERDIAPPPVAAPPTQTAPSAAEPAPEEFSAQDTSTAPEPSSVPATGDRLSDSVKDDSGYWARESTATPAAPQVNHDDSPSTD